jgi:hypothetical protein
MSKKRIMHPVWMGLAFILLVLLFNSCAPVFSDLQSARTAGKGGIELTPSYSQVSMNDEESSDAIQNHIGLQGAYGITPKIDLRLRYEFIGFKDKDLREEIGNFHIWGFGPKFNLLKDNISLYVPVGGILNTEDSDGSNMEIQPTVLFTYPMLNNSLDINLSAKYIIFLSGDDEGSWVAINFGLALGKDVRNFAIRPEYGILFSPGDEGSYRHFSIGLTKNFGSKFE